MDARLEVRTLKLTQGASALQEFPVERRSPAPEALLDLPYRPSWPHPIRSGASPEAAALSRVPREGTWQSIAGLMDQWSKPALLMSESLSLLHRNAAAQQFLDEGLFRIASESQLLPGGPLGRERWLMAVRQAIAEGSTPVHLFLSARIGERRPICLKLTSVRTSASLGGARLVLVTSTPASAVDLRVVSGYANLFALTASETAILASLCQGIPIGKLAERHGVKMSTVRTHIKALLSKVGCHAVKDVVFEVMHCCAT